MDFRSFFARTLIWSCVTAAAFAQCLTEADRQAIDPGVYSRLSEGRKKFAFAALEKTIELETQDNIFFSPHSLHQALSLVYFGAQGSTEQSLQKVLGIPEDLAKTDVTKFFFSEKSFQLEREQNASNYELKIANRLWITEAKEVRDCMLSYFNGEIEKTNFKADPNGARLRINDWVSNTTKGNIRDLLPEKSIDASTDLVLANAMYFKGLWQSKFDPVNTKTDIFYASSNKHVLTTFMSQRGSFNHVGSEKLGAHILKLPYKGEQVSMFILLPPFAHARSVNQVAENGVKSDGLSQLIHRITSTEAGYQELMQIFEEEIPQTVNVAIPKFSLERNLPVKQLLEGLGAGDVISQQADLRGFLADGEGDLHLGDAAHRAKIEVSEEGTTAAAATAIFSFRSSRPFDPTNFKANHPFVYIIYDSSSKSVLFAGVFRKPEQT